MVDYFDIGKKNAQRCEEGRRDAWADFILVDAVDMSIRYVLFIFCVSTDTFG